jgi:hypothetical protein
MSILKLKLLAICLLLGFASVDICRAQGAPDADEYVVYAALFKAKGHDRQGAQVVIDDMTDIEDFSRESYDPKNPDPAINKLTRSLPQLARETALDFLVRNRISWTLKNEFNLSAEIILVKSYETRRLFDEAASLEDGWKQFQAKYPKASSIDTVSRVGFNNGKTQALVYYGYVCGPLCGQGQFVLLTKTGDKWNIEKEWMIWIS